MYKFILRMFWTSVPEDKIGLVTKFVLLAQPNEGRQNYHNGEAGYTKQRHSHQVYIGLNGFGSIVYTCNHLLQSLLVV
jgi:hypothetical protein